ncbi:MAG: FAD-binding protein [Pseudomonadota bacterium]|nr:FAD-binding protein [Pseudomonadota bacterium]
MNTLVVAEHDNQNLNGATASLVSAARKLGASVDVLVAGAGCGSVADAAARIDGVNKVLLADHAVYGHHVAEPLAALVLSLASGYGAILTAASTTGKNFLPRVAAKLDVAQISEVIAIVDASTFVRPIYAGNALATVKSSDAVKVMTVRASSFEPAPAASAVAAIENVGFVAEQQPAQFVSEALSKSARPDLGAAKIVISGGRGLGSAENFKLLEPLADKLGAAIGASRAAVDAGYCRNEMQVGQTGRVVAPELYFAIGISGAIQHLAGMKDSKVIVAINKDAEAPIFQVADYGLVADLFEAIPELTASL